MLEPVSNLITDFKDNLWINLESSLRLRRISYDFKYVVSVRMMQPLLGQFCTPFLEQFSEDSNVL